MADYLRIPEGNFLPQFCRFDDQLLLKEQPNGDCIFYRDGRCMMYPVRPSQCRTFPFWLKNLRSEDAWRETQRTCPGIGKGRRFTREEILALVAESPI